MDLDIKQREIINGGNLYFGGVKSCLLNASSPFTLGLRNTCEWCHFYLTSSVASV
jgi:hypothetical protein